VQFLSPARVFMFDVLLNVVVVFLLFVQKLIHVHVLVIQFSYIFCNVNLLSILSIVHDL